MTFHKASEAALAIETMNGRSVNNRQVKVSDTLNMFVTFHTCDCAM